MIANILGADAGIVLLIALVVLVGGSQLPKLARSIGLAGKEFRNAHDEAMADPPAPIPGGDHAGPPRDAFAGPPLGRRAIKRSTPNRDLLF